MKGPVQRVVFLAIFLLLAFCGIRIYQFESQKRILKAEQIELSHIKYGLFNVDEWKELIAVIISKKIESFQVTRENENEIRKKVESILHTLIDEVERFMRAKNSESIKGIFKQAMTDLLFDFDDVRQGIPEYARVIVERLNDPTTKAELKDFLRQKIEDYADETVGRMDYAYHDAILNKYDSPDRQSCLSLLSSKSQAIQSLQKPYIVIALIAALLLLSLIMAMKLNSGDMIIAILSSSVFLVAGVRLPMIDIEATIQSFSFLLMGEPVLFENQVLFFQSKSILEVIFLLIQNGEPELIFVSFLVFSFSILFPLTKLMISASLLLSRPKPLGKFARFMVFKSAKWSMADVMVIALFMAYIGFSGVINAQLTQIERNSGNLDVFTTDRSTLQLGFYLFTSFVVFNLFLSSKLEKILKRDDQH